MKHRKMSMVHGVYTLPEEKSVKKNYFDENYRRMRMVYIFTHHYTEIFSKY